MVARSLLMAEMPAQGTGGYHTPELLNTITDQYVKQATLAGGLPGEWDIVTLEVRDLVSVGDVLVPFKLDRLVRNADTGDLAQIDTKTSSAPGRQWKADMSRSIQQRFYSWAVARYYGLDVHHVPFVVVEGVDKKGKATGQVGNVVNHWASLGWTDAYVEEAVGYVVAQAGRDREFLNILYQGIDAEGPYSEAQWQMIRNKALLQASQWSMFNYQDCHSYYTPCAYLGACDATPEDRLGLLLDLGIDDRVWHDE